MRTISAAMEIGLTEKPPFDPGRAIIRAFARISWRPVTLFLALLLVNSVARPYSDLIHDSRLYAVMVLNRADPGLFSDDLFLRYGSQDSFSIFSRLVSPVAKQVGLRPTFFLFYLFSNALMLYFAQRFVMSFVRQRMTAAIALVYLAVNPVVLGGLDVFHVNETFLTPRLWAIALVFFALEQLVHDRRWRSLLLITLALIIHPIMAFSGLLVWLYVTLTASLGIQRTIAIGVGCGLVVLLALLFYPIGSAIFGPMDNPWRQNVLTANEYINPSEWLARDWLRIGTAFVITFLARQQVCFCASVRRCLDAIMFAAVIGLLGATFAPHLPYALPLQAQQYRAVWLLQFIQIPLAVLLLRHVWRSGNSHAWVWIAPIGGAFAVGTMSMTMIHLISLAGLVLLCRLGLSAWRRQEGARPGWVGLILWGLGGVVCIAPLLAPFVTSNPMSGTLSPSAVMRCVPLAIGAPMTLLAGLVSLVALYHWTGSTSRFGILALGGCLTIHTIFFATEDLPKKRQVAALRQFLEYHHREPNQLPTIYWPRSGLDDVWVGLRAKCYFTKQQAAGNMFHRETAIECQRRALVVRPFELLEITRRGVVTHSTRELLEMLGEDPPSDDPTLRDLYRLCCEEIDFVITRDQFDGFYSENIGPFFVYECAKIRDGLGEQLGTAAPKSLSLKRMWRGRLE